MNFISRMEEAIQALLLKDETAVNMHYLAEQPATALGAHHG